MTRFSVIMVSVCLPSDALLQHLTSYLGFSYLGREVSLHSCSTKVQLLFLSLDEWCLLPALLFFFLSTSLLSPPSPFLIHNYFSGCLGASHMYSHTVSSFLNGFYYFFFSSPPYNNSTNNSGACVNFVEILTKPLHSGRSNQCHLVLTFA